MEKEKGDVKLANKSTVIVVAKGSIQIIITTRHEENPIWLENTLYILDLRTNLLSVARIVDKGYTETFTQNDAIVKDEEGNMK